MHSVAIRHNFESAHRLPHLPGKCQSLHGHSFWAEVSIGHDRRLADDGIVIEYGRIKAWTRNWIDRHWDHGTLLGAQDPLVVNAASGEYAGASDVTDLLGKVYLFQGGLAGHWPTVEVLAWHLGIVIGRTLRDWNRDPNVPEVTGLYVDSVTVRETSVNAATWINPEVP
jgi:6-pyruvoyltetrahydropterin/6-carboxytetrahydropterin synthase